MKHEEVLLQVHRLGAQVCKATSQDDFHTARQVRNRIHALLRKEIHDRPELLPGLLRLKSAWHSRRSESLRLLFDSYTIARKRRNNYQSVLSAAALAEAYVSQERVADEAKAWLGLAKKIANSVKDPSLQDEIKRVEGKLGGCAKKN